ncbi:RidA family protein [Clostridium botulinum]|uniref:RidA family protein n=1 Tax=Clostridium botulinum TaxID=1491 RepID=A0A0C2S6X0_CLOBO|nr:RidA family protein [Clostridium botulinum]EES48373.1 endoribonuclease L-PSP, putative [Clostridium botulinum E1 str. 'BoNT E Beluga']KAI3349716.1 RidA family protein [Clostridium botulinum]KIL08847.1 endoribonuclease L-PSP [Clostridium botulinum]KOM87375.1 endoribonuclease L-PSP [Clostridium botulinum]KOR65438.1 endoribonuclease L-PSP [Clostridium botulinum]
MKKIINTQNAPEAIGPYSQGIIIDKLVYTSGQLPINPKTKILETEIKQATKQSLENCRAILEEAGTNLENVIKTTVFVKDLNDFSAVNEVYATYFTQNFPARSCVQIAKLPMDALIEIEVIATL